MKLPRISHCRAVVALLAGTVVSSWAAAQTPILAYDLNETSGDYLSSGSLGKSVTPAGSNQTWGADGSGVSGLPGDRAWDASANTTRGADTPANNARLSGATDVDLSTLSAFTMTFWYNSEQGFDSAVRYLYKANATTPTSGFTLRSVVSGSNAGLEIQVGNGTSATAALSTKYSSGQGYNQINTWVFAAVVWDGTQINFYVGDKANAVSSASSATPFPGPIANPAGVALYIGNLASLNRGFDGKMDNVRIYDQALSPSDLETLRTADVAGYMGTKTLDIAITAQPYAQIVNAGRTATMSVIATGLPAPTYQWKKNGADLDGATSAILEIPNVSAADAGDYSVVVANNNSSITSSSAALSIVGATDDITLINETFADGDRNGQNPPTSLAWFQNRSASNPDLTATAGSMSINSDSSQTGARHAVAHFTRSTLSVGDSLVLDFDFKPTGTMITHTNGMRFGLFDSNRDPVNFFTADGYNPSGNTSHGYVGVFNPLEATLLVSATSISERRNDPESTASTALLTNSGAYNTLLAAQSLDQVFTSGTTYHGRMTITRTEGEAVQVEVRYSGGDLAEPVAYSIADTEDVATSFDTIGFSAVGTTIDVLTLSNIQLTFTPDTAPAIVTQPASQTVNAGSNVTLSVVASGEAPLSYQWQKDGADIDGATAASLALNNVSTADSGSYAVVVTNSHGSVTSATAVLTVNLAPVSIDEQPVGAVVLSGSEVVLSVSVSGSAPIEYQWEKDGVALSGATEATLTLTNAQPAQSGTYRVVVTNPVGSVASESANVVISDSAVAPQITGQPASETVAVGQGVTLKVNASGAPAPTYQWFKDGVAISGATSATYTIAAVSPADAGSYTVAITNSAGTVTSTAAVLTVNSSYLSNLSVRASMGAQQTLIVGFVVTGGSKPILIRAAGPALKETFDLDGVLADPQLTLYNADGVSLASNDDWSDDLTTTFAQLGAFTFVPGSKDAALLDTVTSANTSHAPGGASGGIQLVELYDAGENNGVRLANVSARNRCGTGNDILIAGFVISGSGKKSVLVRGIGPGLAYQFDLTGVLADPQLTVYDVNGDPVASNDDWSGDLAGTFATLGAFDLESGSKDAALLVELDPGVYTAQVRGAGNGTGDALVEIYDAAP